MSVSSLVNRFSNSGSLGESPPPSTGTRRHYSTGSAGSSRSESPASTDSPQSPHPDGGSSSNRTNSTDDPRVRLGSISEDKIRMFESRSSEGGPVIKRGAGRQMSSGCVEGRGREKREGLKDKRQLSAPGLGGKGRPPSLFRLPGMSGGATESSEDVQETDIDETIDSLQSDDPTLTELNLNNHTRLDAALISQLLEALRGNTHLKILSLANIRFSEDHAKQLAEVLKVNTSLKVLNLESNRITRKGIAAMMKALAENKETAITELRMANQYFPGGAGAESDIAKHLEKIMSIIRLGYNFTSPSIRTRIDRYMMRNTDLIRQKRASLVV